MFENKKVKELSSANEVLRKKIEELINEKEKLSIEKEELRKVYDFLTDQERKKIEDANKRLEGVDELGLDAIKKREYILSIKSERHYEMYKDYIKKIVDAIVDLEAERSGINFDKLDVCVVTVYEYFKNVQKNKKFKLENGNTYDENMYKYRGFTNLANQDIIVVLQNGEYDQIMDVIITVFHELQHYEDSEIMTNMYVQKDRESLASYLDYQLLRYDNTYYKSYHDQNMFEIHANIRSIIKTEDFLISNKLIYGVSDEDKEYLSVLGTIYEFDRYLYNYYETFDRFIKVYRKNKDVIVLPSFLQMFLNSDGSFKDIESIVNNLIVFEDNLDYNGMIAMVLCSNSFREEVFDRKNYLDKQLSEIESKMFNLVSDAYSKKYDDEHILTTMIGNEIDSFDYHARNLVYAGNKKFYFTEMRNVVEQFKKIYPSKTISFDKFYAEIDSINKHL